MIGPPKKLRAAALLFTICVLAGPLRADSITVGGGITQSTQDSGMPAVANMSLTNVADNDLFAVVMNFKGTISSPGTYSLSSIDFVDAIAGATESAFISGSMTITQVGPADQFSVLGCLIDAINCTEGNELDLNFQIPAAQLNQTLATAQSIPSLLPFDLLEDGGNTDIHGIHVRMTLRLLTPADHWDRKQSETDQSNGGGLWNS